MSALDPVTFLVYNIGGGGGVARTVINLANELAATRQVRIISMVDRRAGTMFEIDDQITVTYLQTLAKDEPKGLQPDDRRWRDRPSGSWRSRRLASRPTSLSHHDNVALDPGMTAWGDRLLRRELRALAPGILITTRPSLHLAAARWAPDHVTTIGQDHLNFPTRSKHPAIMAAQREAVMGLDAFVVLTRADLADYREWAPDATARLEAIPNGSSWPVSGERAELVSHVAIAGGRFEKRKGFRRMVRAWSEVAAQFPDWQLHIYGRGEEQESIEAAIEKWGVADSVVLKGFTTDFDQVLMSSSIYLMTSLYEGFPMVLVEAMGKGLPLVAYDCPRGPGDVIEDGANGRLVADGDRAGFADALRELMGDVEVRQRMGAAGAQAALGYRMPRIVERWEQLFRDLGRS